MRRFYFNNFIKRMLLALLFIGLLISSGNISAQKIIQIGELNSMVTSSYIPKDALDRYSFCQTIYQQSEIGQARTITHLYYPYEGTSWTENISIYLGHTKKNKFETSNDWMSIDSFDKVFEGELSFSSGWVTIKLDTPFEYNNQDNLMVGFEYKTSNFHQASNYFYTYDTDEYTSLRYSDVIGNQIDLNNPPSGIQFKMNPCVKFQVLNMYDADIASISSPEAQFSMGTKDITVVLKNLGTEELTSVDIDWSINDIEQETYKWTGSIAAKNSEQVKIGTFDFNTIGTYKITVNSSMPNGKDDESGISSYTAEVETLPIISSFPFFEDFEMAKETPNGWSNSGSWNFYEYYNLCKAYDESKFFAHVNIKYLNRDQYLVSPLLDLGSEKKRLKYYAWIGNGTGDKPLSVEISADEGQSWTSLKDHVRYETSNKWVKHTVNLDSYINQKVLIRFKARRYGSIFGGEHSVGIDNISVFKPFDMSFDSAITKQTAGKITLNPDQKIIEVEVNMKGTENPMDITEITFSTNGTQVVNTIKNARLAWADNPEDLSSLSQIGPEVSNPNGEFSIPFSHTLIEDKNNFWLIYEMNGAAESGTIVDAECTSVTVGGVKYDTEISAPAGVMTYDPKYYMPKGAGHTLTVNECVFYDDGGENKDHSPYFLGSTTIFPSSAESKVKIEFLSFDLAKIDNLDRLYLGIWNGSDFNEDDLAKTYNGVNIPETSYVSSAEDGSLGIEFYAHNLGNYSGWEAKISCVSSNAKLSDIKINGQSLDIFEEEELGYNILFPFGTSEVPEITYILANTNATVKQTNASSLAGTTSIEVTAEDGMTIKTYILNMSVALSPIATVDDLLIDGKSINGFTKDQYEYTVELPYGTHVVPELTYVLTDEKAKAVVSPATELPGTTYLDITSENEEFKNTYSIDFNIALNDRNEISSFVFNSLNPIVEGIIDHENSRVDLVVSYFSNITAIAPLIEVSEAATITPASNEVQNFSNPIEYTVKAENGDEKIYTIYVSVVTGINDIEDSNIKIYPNPVSDFLIISNIKTTEFNKFCIYNNLGHKLMTQELEAGSNEINLNLLSTGAYILVLQGDSKTTSHRLIKK